MSPDMRGMQEQILFDFLEGRVDPTTFSGELAHAQITPEPWNTRSSGNYLLTPIREPQGIKTAHIIRLIEALEQQALTPEQVAITCFIMEMSPDRFLWDTDDADCECVANLVFWLGTPQINYPLTSENLSKMRDYAMTGRNSLSTEVST
jgi:hypothetical protein